MLKGAESCCFHLDDLGYCRPPVVILIKPARCALLMLLTHLSKLGVDVFGYGSARSFFLFLFRATKFLPAFVSLVYGSVFGSPSSALGLLAMAKARELCFKMPLMKR